MSWVDALDRNRNRVGWWVYLGLLGLGLAFVFHSFVGTFIFGIVIYYASRPVFHRLRPHLGDGLAASATLLGFVVPVLVVVAYILVAGLQDFASLAGQEDVARTVAPLLNVEELTEGQQTLVSTLSDLPGRLQSLPFGQAGAVLGGGLAFLGTVTGGLVHVSLSFAAAFFLLRDGDRIAAWFRESIADRDTTGYAYATAVDEDLETVFFGNVLFIATIAVLATLVYYGFNFVAPPALSIPFAVLLALLTGVASLVPLVVGKLVYVPVVVYVGAMALQSGGASLVYPAGLLAVCFLLLDILPQTFVQPYITGRETHSGILMFAYLLGPMLFGWYGFFLLPVFVVLVLQAVRLVLTELVHGEGLTPEVNAAPSLGSDPPDQSGESGESGESGQPSASDSSLADGGDEGDDSENGRGDGSETDRQ
ncbi:AI-2E family transporter (plasmid) [Halorussus salilacus]|uniref:AI-2E family transporter n=1 Tax=Halorussus salilacus TaxID=2953750 RepID=UPI0020A09030|nr:AI-2E family transporter [Halorussus salilacus]USZ69708.1 AI-2E family transporter [Halorussus salilacus]